MRFNYFDFLVSFTLISINIACFQFNVSVPLIINVFGLILCFILIYRSFNNGKIGLVSFLVVCIYCLPFIHIIPYLWFNFSDDPLLMWGMIAVPYQTDQVIIELLASMAVTGTASFTLVSSFMKKNSNSINIGWYQDNSIRKNFDTLNLFNWIILLLIGIYLSYLSAPTESIFTSQYATVSSSSRESNASSVWLGSYIILIFLTVDSVFETRPNRSMIKNISLIISLFYIIVILQFLRGDRESLPWVLSLFLIYFYWCNKYRKGPQAPSMSKSSVFMVGGSFFVVSFLVAITRSTFTDVDLVNAGEIIWEYLITESSSINNIIKGTWSAVLLTPLSVAGDYVNNNMEYNYGKDYLDLFLSIPPGFVADIFNYERPIGLGKGPASEMLYGQGGTHALVLPFRAYGVIGIAFITAFWFSMLIKLEQFLLRRFNIFSISFLAVIVSVAPHWMWYGEKNIMNGVIYFFISAIFYLLFISPSLRNTKIYRF